MVKHQIEEFTTILNSEQASSTEGSVKERLKFKVVQYMIHELFAASVSRYVYFVVNV